MDMEISRIGIHPSVDELCFPDRLQESLSDIDVEVVVVDDTRTAFAACDAIVTFDHRDAFLETVDWIHSVQAGYDHFPLDDLETAGVVLTSSTGIHGNTVGETVAGYMLMLARHLHAYVGYQQRCEWYRPAIDAAFTLTGTSVCVVGLGTIGRGIAERADALGMRVTGVRRTPDSVPGVERVYGSDDLHSAIETARFVAIAVPLNDETHHMIGPDELEAMREDAYLINVARGAVVDEEALVDALRGDEIAGAALDVFEEEPLPEESPLWGMDDVIISPHRAAITDTYHEDIADLVRENLRRLDAGEEWLNRVV